MDETRLKEIKEQLEKTSSGSSIGCEVGSGFVIDIYELDRREQTVIFNNPGDGRFFLHARKNVRDLVAEVERLRRALVVVGETADVDTRIFVEETLK